MAKHGQSHAEQSSHHEHAHKGHGSFKSYLIGFLLSIVLTIIPIAVVLNDMFERTPTLVIILIAAVLQFVVQLLFFMHLRDEEKPRYNLTSLLLGLFILVVIVAGSIWIMTYNAVAV